MTALERRVLLAVLRITMAALLMLLGASLFVLATYPQCPTQNACETAYRDGVWEIRELPDGEWGPVSRP